MPRVGDVMQLLSGTLAVPNTTIQSAPYNAQQNDWVLDANNPRPITAGGTGATTATQARTNLGAIGATDLATAATKTAVIGTDSMVIIDSEDTNKNKRWLVSTMKTQMSTLTDLDFTLNSSNATATEGPSITFNRLSATPAVNDLLGCFVFNGKNSAAETVPYADILTRIDDPINNSEDGALIFRCSVAGGMSPCLTLNAAGASVQNLTVATSAIFNGSVTYNSPPTFTDSFTLSSTDAGAAAGPLLLIDRMSASPLSGDLGGQILFRGKTSAAATTVYADIQMQIDNPTTSATTSSLLFKTHTAGSLTPALTLGATLVTIHSQLQVTGNTISAGIGSTTGRFSGVSPSTNTIFAHGSNLSGGSLYFRPDGTESPTGQAILNNTGSLVLSGNTVAIGTTSAIVATGSAAGAIRLRPDGAGSTTGEVVVSSTGVTATTVTATTSVADYFRGSGTSGTEALLGTNSAGNVRLRPNGVTSTTNETRIDNAGIMWVSSHILNGSNSGIGSASFGIGHAIREDGIIITKSSGTALTSRIIFNNGAVAGSSGGTTVGSITTSAAVTAYVTSSDEFLKDVQGSINPLDAIDIIRADPVLTWTWKESGDQAVGWVAQKSYAVDPNLAVPPPEPTGAEGKTAPGDEGYIPWGIDYGKRTPYLWAALTWALDKIDELETRLTILEGTPA